MIKKTKQVSFKQYLGCDNYGTISDRNALKCKINLTTDKIDEIVKNSKNIDDGILTAYKQLMNENVHLNNAFLSMGVITKHYLHAYKERLAEIKKTRPYGSKIPVVGLILDYQAKQNDKFINRIGGYCDDLIDDFNQIVENYFHKGLNNIVNDYTKNKKHLSDGIDYVNEVRGHSEIRDVILERLNNQTNCLKDSYNNLGKELNQLSETLEKMSEKIIKQCQKAHSKRLTIRTTIKVISAGVLG